MTEQDWIAKDYYWSFGNKTYEDFEDFKKAFIDYNLEIHNESPTDFQLSNESSITLLFRGVDLEVADDEYQDMSATISSRNGAGLMFFEFMFLANNSLYEFLCNADHIFFEGLIQVEREGHPTFSMLQGS